MPAAFAAASVAEQDPAAEGFVVAGPAEDWLAAVFGLGAAEGLVVALVVVGHLLALVVYPDSVAALELEVADLVVVERLDPVSHAVALGFAAAGLLLAVALLVAAVAELLVVVSAGPVAVAEPAAVVVLELVLAVAGPVVVVAAAAVGPAVVLVAGPDVLAVELLLLPPQPLQQGSAGLDLLP